MGQRRRKSLFYLCTALWYLALSTNKIAAAKEYMTLEAQETPGSSSVYVADGNPSVDVVPLITEDQTSLLSASVPSSRFITKDGISATEEPPSHRTTTGTSISSLSTTEVTSTSTDSTTEVSSTSTDSTTEETSTSSHSTTEVTSTSTHLTTEETSSPSPVTTEETSSASPVTTEETSSSSPVTSEEPSTTTYFTTEAPICSPPHISLLSQPTPPSPSHNSRGSAESEVSIQSLEEVKCFVEPQNSKIKPYFTVPRTLKITWSKSVGVNSYLVCLHAKGASDCLTSTEPSALFPWVPAGEQLVVSVSSIDGVYCDCRKIYIPWQFRVAGTDNSIAVSWIRDSLDFRICQMEDIGRFPQWSDLWTHCEKSTNSQIVFEGLKPDTPYWISVDETTIFHTKTLPEGKYRSLAFYCNQQGVCGEDLCRPITGGVVLEFSSTSPVPASYPYICIPSDPDVHPGPSVTIKGDIFLSSVAFFSGGLGGPIEECVHATAMALVKFWCNGLPSCQVDFRSLHSHLAGAEGCRGGSLEDYRLHYSLWEEDPEPDCLRGHFFVGHRTCYEATAPGSFLEAQDECRRRGGDVVFYDQGNDAFLDFLEETLGPAEEGWWVQGLASNDTAPRGPGMFSEEADWSYVAAGGSFHKCVFECKEDQRPAICALPPELKEKEPERLSTSTEDEGLCSQNPCLNEGVCFRTTLALGEAVAIGEESIMCNCTEGFSGDLCQLENTDSVIDSIAPEDDGVYRFNSTEGNFHFEFVHFGREKVPSFSGCYALAALSLFRLKCEGQSYCELSYEDLQNHLHSSCHPAVPPLLSVRYTLYASSENWRCMTGIFNAFCGCCILTSPQEIESPREAKIYCNRDGGELASSEDYQPGMCTANASSVWVDGSPTFHTHPHFHLTPKDPQTISCGGQTTSSTSSTPSSGHSALCVYAPELTGETTTHSSSISTSTARTSSTTEVPAKHCPTTKPFPSVFPDYVWKETDAGQVANNSCPWNDVIVTWNCGLNGEWEGLPDLSKCNSIDTGRWEDELTNGEQSAGQTLDNFVSNTTADNLQPGDITNTLELLEVARFRHEEDIKNLTESESLNVTEVYTEAVTKVSDLVLRKPQLWFGIPPEQRANASTRVQLDVEVSAIELAHLLVNATKEFHTKTISVKVKRYHSHHYGKEENRIFRHADRSGTFVQLPEDFMDEDEDFVAVTFASYNTLHCVLGENIICEPNDLSPAVSPVFPLRQVVNSPVVGLSVGNTSWSSDGLPVTATFQGFFTRDKYNLSGVTCMFWDVDSNSWSSDGCRLVSFSGSTSVCSCDHLTNLAVIMDVNGIFAQDPFLQWFTVIGCSISLVCLVLAIMSLTSLLVRSRLRFKTTTTIHLNLCCCLAVVELLLLVGLDRTEDPAGCGVVAGFLHYFLLATFCWMGAEGLNVYFLLIRVFPTSRSPLRYYVAASYSIPALIVTISAALRPHGYGTPDYCWLSVADGLIWAFMAPALLILLFNLIMFTCGVLALRKADVGILSAAQDLSEKEGNRMLRASGMLAAVLGLTWIFGYFMMFADSVVAYAMAVVFTVSNSLQGVVLFVAVVVMNPVAWRRLKNLVSCGRVKDSSSRSSALGTSHSGGRTRSSSLPMGNPVPAVSINPRGSGELDLCVARDIELRVRDRARNN